MEELYTRWGKSIDPARILPEYPRPQMVRGSYLNLNGTWEYELDGSSGTILVPFSPESKLSGVEKTLRPGQILHYRRTFTLPEGFRKDRVILHFGGVDQECTVFVNAQQVGSHAGGYLAFSFDITDYLKDGENELTLEVRDSTEFAPHARGKQKLVKLKGRLSYLFYTPQSGIWKTVWLESVPSCHIRGIRITPEFDSSSVRFDFDAVPAREMNLAVLDGEKVLWEYRGAAADSLTVSLPGLTPWSPENPKLYDVAIRWGEDEIRSYFGMRKLSAQRDSKGILRFFLNNEPYFFSGVLDQGYWPESLMTPPCDDALQHDILTLKAMGFNTIRKHIKVESDRFYYHCDRLGMAVWQDMPNGGDAYNMPFVTYLPNVLPWSCRHVPDTLYALFGRKSESGRQQFRRDLAGMVTQLYSHPCIAAWTPFNEGWGQFDAKDATALIRDLDATRLVNEACGWFDQGGGDMFSIHNYFRRLKVRPQKDRVVALTEFGGYAYAVPGHTACEKKVGYKSYESPEVLTQQLKKLWQEQLLANLPAGLSASIYTQTSDIEEEINGLMTYDRAVEKFDPEELRALNRELYSRFRDCV